MNPRRITLPAMVDGRTVKALEKIYNKIHSWDPYK